MTTTQQQAESNTDRVRREFNELLDRYERTIEELKDLLCIEREKVTTLEKDKHHLHTVMREVSDTQASSANDTSDFLKRAKDELLYVEKALENWPDYSLTQAMFKVSHLLNEWPK